jgi:hypothetical protein
MPLSCADKESCGNGLVKLEGGDCCWVSDLEDEEITNMSFDRVFLIEREMAHYWAKESPSPPINRADVCHTAARVMKARGARCCNAMYSQILSYVSSLPSLDREKLERAAEEFELYNGSKNKEAADTFLRMVEDGVFTSG